MVFTSIHFLVFFNIVAAVYYLLPHRFRWQWLLIASSYFYMAFIPIYILILVFLILVDYFAGIWIDRESGQRRKIFLIISCVANLSILGVFKYFNFVNDNITRLYASLGWHNPITNLNIILPIGLSFHVFQSLSYTIDVYFRQRHAEKHLGIYALYVLFFPQLVAGPIERSTRLLDQFKQVHEFDYEKAVSGLKVMVWGFFQKIVIADRLALFVNEAYGNPSAFSGTALLLATVFFAFQIYCDFSAYSTIAIGAARMLGFELMVNFNSPYFSLSVAEFWKRWHISLSSWFRDYVYIPLGGNRVSGPRQAMNILIVFFLSGLWHGANWTFVIWGLIHGVFVSIQTLIERRYPLWLEKTTALAGALFTALRLFVTFSVVCLSWIFFRAISVTQAWEILKKIIGSLPRMSPGEVTRSIAMFSSSKLELFLGLSLIAFILAAEYLSKKRGLLEKIQAMPWPMRWSLYYASVLAILIFGRFETVQFIYFQF